MDEFAIVVIPFLGTSLGAAMVFCLKENINPGLERLLLGFASGVMIAASVWSLLIPAMEMAEQQGKTAWLPGGAGLLLGVAFLLLLDNLVLYMQSGSAAPWKSQGDEGNGGLCSVSRQAEVNSEPGKGKTAEGSRKVTMLILAVALHNLPEGMAVGVALAGAMRADTGITMAGAMMLSVGIAIQNLPEGAIISMPLRSEGDSRIRAFRMGVLSGVVEPAGAVLTLLLAELVIPVLPYLLALAAGAMLYVAANELIPEACSGENGRLGTVSMAAGFALMMVLDVAA